MDNFDVKTIFRASDAMPLHNIRFYVSFQEKKHFIQFLLTTSLSCALTVSSSEYKDGIFISDDENVSSIYIYFDFMELFLSIRNQVLYGRFYRVFAVEWTAQEKILFG